MAASSTATGYADRLSSGAYFGDVNLRPEPDPPAVATGKIAVLAAAVRAAGGRVVVHTGAGLSTAAGIRDFRSTDGVWTAAAADKARRLQKGKAGVDSPRESWSPLSDRDGADSGGDGACGGGDPVPAVHVSMAGVAPWKRPRRWHQPRSRQRQSAVAPARRRRRRLLRRRQLPPRWRAPPPSGPARASSEKGQARRVGRPALRRRPPPTSARPPWRPPPNRPTGCPSCQPRPRSRTYRWWGW